MQFSIQGALDGFYWLRHHSIAVLAFGVLRIYAVEVTYKQVQEGTYQNRIYSALRLEEVKDIDTLLSISEENLKRSSERRSSVADKCKTLLTLGSLLLALVGLLLPKYLAFESILMRLAAVFAIVCLFVEVILLLKFFDVGKETELVISQDEIALDEVNLKKSLLNCNLQVEISRDNRTDYLVICTKVPGSAS